MCERVAANGHALAPVHRRTTSTWKANWANYLKTVNGRMNKSCCGMAAWHDRCCLSNQWSARSRHRASENGSSLSLSEHGCACRHSRANHNIANTTGRRFLSKANAACRVVDILDPVSFDYHPWRFTQYVTTELDSSSDADQFQGSIRRVYLQSEEHEKAMTSDESKNNEENFERTFFSEPIFLLLLLHWPLLSSGH